MVGDLHGQRAPAQVAVASSSTLTVARTGLWTLLAAHLVALWGLSWDIRWHLLIGRDSFWIAPHIMTYSGVAAIGFVSFGVFGWTGIRGFRGAGVLDVLRHLGGTGSRGYHLAALAITLTVLAAPLDELWHRMFGLDVTIWSPSASRLHACLPSQSRCHPHPKRRRRPF
jgi:hypothetical protein